jgi:hypothetical protein
VGNAVGGRTKMVCGESADFLRLIAEAITLASDITRGLVLIWATAGIVCFVLILLGIFLIVHIM